ncbi:NIPSNAP family protein [Undibacterium sp. CY18W]|uniref:NIPSNAP family protein n=1 Tax=Undibacterium hunanense TaxID=2762292 RepID=A0ABR6ZSE4_9BURK|nr:NIPSNAP family protein [Undibacterium hunanense]MBC3918458.1 NIPSNAP family protein [Undibacterium hunanense]
MKRLIEIRTYRLKPGMAEAFHQAVHGLAVPMLKSRNMDVVAYGHSDHEEATYYLIRSYESRDALEQEQNAFYGSSEWKDGPRKELVDCIDSYMNTLIWVSAEAIESMRELNQA